MKATRVAATLSTVLGLGFGLPGLYGAVHLASKGEVWTFLGFPTYGHGPFESVGLETTVPLQAGFVAVCAAEVLDGWLLWRGRPAGRVLSWLLLPAELAYWLGFALPFGPLLGVPRTALVVASKRKPVEDQV